MEMPRYRSHKRVWALKIKEVNYSTPNPGLALLKFEDGRYADRLVSIVNRPNPEAGWYFVSYEDGYHSFSPSAQFLNGNTLESEPVAVFDMRGFGWALKQLHFGERVCREGWNGKGMWLKLQVPDEHSKMTLPYIYIEYPEGHPAYPKGCRVPWLASQTDLLAMDYRIAS